MAVFGATVLADVKLSNGDFERVSTYVRIEGTLDCERYIDELDGDTLHAVDPYDFIANTEGIPDSVYIDDIVEIIGYVNWELEEEDNLFDEDYAYESWRDDNVA